MHKGTILITAIFLVTAWTAVPASAAPPLGTLEGMVINVQDGDHLTVTNAGTEIDVRLYGVRTPIMARDSMANPGLPQLGQPFAERAFMALTKKVLHKVVKLEIMHIDRRQRTVAIVWVEGRDVNLEMVDEGWAWASRKSRELKQTYRQAETEARARRLGLWAQETPQPPWEFRRARKAQYNTTSRAW